MRSLICAIALWIIAAVTALAGERTVYVALGEEATRIASYCPFPQYPSAARYRRITGRGSIRLIVEFRTGRVTASEIAQSTGSTILDEAALRTFRQWRFKPEALRALKNKYNPNDTSPDMGLTIPVNFTL